MVELAQAQVAVRGEAPGNAEPGQDTEIILERRGNHSVTCKWNIAGFGNSSSKQKVLYSKYFEVGGYDCRLLVYPSGDAQALPGYMSLYLQISDPGSSSSKWDCFASYQLAVRNLADDTKSVRRDSWHRFSAKKRSHGWCDFAALTTLLDAKQGFLGPGGIIQVSTDITILDESVSFTRESDLGGNISLSSTDVFSGKFVWRVQNFSVFQPLLRTQKIMSPAFPAGDCALRMSVYQSTVGGSEFLSVCLESKDTEKTGSTDRTCWCLFRLAVQPQSEDGGKVVHRDSYGRFAFDSRSGDNTSLGWNDFMKLSDFTAPEAAYLVGDTAVFSTSFHVIRETSSLVRYVEPRGALAAAGAPSRLRDKRKSTNHRESEWTGRFQWRLENFTRLKDLLKKRKITGLCIKSRRFSVGGKDCRLIVYPRGQSQPPTFLSVFLEVTDPAPASPDWTCFVSHRLSVVNQRGESERSIAKESQNRYSKTAKDWGWREFVSLTTLFDADAGFLVNDAVVFSAEVLVLKESSETKVVPLPGPIPAALEAPPAVASPAPAANGDAGADANGQEGEKDAAAAVAVPAADSKVCFAWRVENFGVFKDVVETRKIFSQFFNAGPCDVRVGLYESFDSLCVYLESDAAVTPAPPPPAPGTPGNGTPAAPEKPPSYWVRYRAAIMNQKAPEKTQWREGSVYTRSWNNSVLQFPRMATSPDSGRVLRDSLLVAVEILEVKPWSQDTTETAVVDANTSAQSGAVGQSTGGADHGATAARRARPSGDGSSTEADSDSLGSDIDDDDDDDSAIDDDDDELESGLAADMEVEDALARWLLAAGLDLVGGIDEHPPVLADVSSVQKLLEDMLTRQNGALPMFTASLRMYMSSLTRVKRLLLPSLMTSPDFGDIYGVGPAVMTVLAGVPSMQPHLLSMLVDVMLDHTLTAKMHRHLFSDNHDAEGTAGSGSDAPAVVEGGPSASPDEVPAAAVPVKAPRTPTAQDAQLAAHGAPADAATNGVLDSGNGVIDIYIPTTEEADETLGIILGWMRSIDPQLLQPPPCAGPASSMSTLSTLHKVSMLLADAPRSLQPDIIALVPRMVSQSEHTAAAGALLGRLAEASREGPEVEADLRLPVLAALGTLQIDPSVANKVLSAALEALPGLSHRELPPAIGLVLKLAATDDATCRTALAAVRLRVNALDAASSSAAGAIDALRLSVVQHPVVARAALATFKEECRAAASCDGATADGAPQLSLADTHVMLDCLSMPSLRDEGVKTLDACVSAGRVDSTVIADCMEQRNTARALHIDPSNAEQPSEPANAPEAGGAEADAAAKRTPVVSSVAQQIFIAAHPVNDGFMPAEGLAPATASQLQLHFSDNASPSGLPPLALSASADELGGALAAAESLLKAKGPGCQGIGAALFVAAFKYCPPTHQLRVLQSLVHLAISGPGGPAVCTAAVLSAAKGLNPTADVTNALPSTAASAAQVASFLLSYLTTLFPDNSEMIIRVLLESAATAAQQVQATKQSMATAAQEHAQQLAAERSAATKAKAEARRAAEQLSELETQVARQRAEYQAELAGAASDRKEMQAQLRAAEQQVEWVRSERDEERAVRARESKEAAQRVAEAEAQLARLKATRRDELKRSQKDRAALLDRARELEESAEAAQAEATRLRSESSRMEKAVADARRRAEGAERSLASKDGEIASLRAAIAERDAQLRVSAEAQQRLQQMLAGEQQRMAMLAGASGLPNHLGQLSPTGKGPYRQVGPMQQPGQPQQAQQGPPGMGAHGMASLSAAGSLDSLHSLQGGAPGPSGSLFSGGSWGLGNHSAGAPRQSSAPAPGQDDSANMEKLLGLLPSDLLHS